jgi:hypothetical protein
MKKLTILLAILALANANKSYAQFTATSVNPTTTNNDVSIQTPLNQGNLTVFRGDVIQNMGGTTFTYPKPAVSILQHSPGMLATCMFCTPTNAPQSIFEIMGATYSYAGGQNGAFAGYTTPVFTIGGDCQMKLGGAAKAGFSNAIYGINYLHNNTLEKGKFRITTTAATITNPDWVNFPYSFAVETGNSLFSNNVRCNGTMRIGAQEATNAFANYRLSVDGDIICRRQVVQISDWADYVFAPNYNLKPLSEVATYIAANKHLPNMPSETEIVKTGLDLGEIQKLQQAKIEELTLYLIEMKKELDELKKNK